MLPTRREIEEAAYYRWQRRGGGHGSDRDDWAAAERDAAFARNYRYLARHRLDDPTPVRLVAGAPGRCRYCERAGPPAAFPDRPALDPAFGHTSLVVTDECDDCRAHDEACLRGAFASFARPLLGPTPEPPFGGVPAPALKALVKMGLALVPGSELHHLGDAVEWVFNPDHDLDAATLAHLGCRVYLTPAPIARPFAALAQRVDDDAALPYLVFFLGASRVVFQASLPLCPRDEDLDDDDLRGPELSMSLGDGPAHAPSRCVYLPVAAVRPPARRAVFSA
jgi:hypothetical protein